MVQYEPSSLVPWAPASLVWPQLAALLSPWLRWDARGAARWRDAALAGAAADRYLADADIAVRQILVDYYMVRDIVTSMAQLVARWLARLPTGTTRFYM